MGKFAIGIKIPGGWKYTTICRLIATKITLLKKDKTEVDVSLSDIEDGFPEEWDDNSMLCLKLHPDVSFSADETYGLFKSPTGDVQISLQDADSAMSSLTRNGNLTIGSFHFGSPPEFETDMLYVDSDSHNSSERFTEVDVTALTELCAFRNELVAAGRLDQAYPFGVLH
jgi:hypothetical protein